jgi:hypothetical protein
MTSLVLGDFIPKSLTSSCKCTFTLISWVLTSQASEEWDWVCPSYSICLCRWPKCELVTQLFLAFENQFFCKLIEFPMTKPLEIRCLSHLRSKNFLITFIKSYSMRAFQPIPRVSSNSPIYIYIYIYIYNIIYFWVLI